MARRKVSETDSGGPLTGPKFTMTPHWMVELQRRGALTSTSLVVWVALGAYSSGSSGGGVFPGVKTLALVTGLTTRAVQKHLSALEDAELLTITERYTKEGRQTTNAYEMRYAPTGEGATFRIGSNMAALESGEGARTFRGEGEPAFTPEGERGCVAVPRPTKTYTGEPDGSTPTGGEAETLPIDGVVVAEVVDDEQPPTEEQVARRLVSWWWDREKAEGRAPIGGQRSYFSSVAVVKAALKAGREPHAIGVALKDCRPPLTMAALEHWLNVPFRSDPRTAQRRNMMQGWLEDASAGTTVSPWKELEA